MQGAGNARLTVESRDPVGCVRSARGRLRGPCVPGQVGEVSVTDVELVMVRRGAAGRRWFRRVPLDVNGTPDGRYAGRQARRLRAAVALARGHEFCSRELVWQTVILPVNSFLIADWSSTEIAVGFGAGSRGHDDIGASVPVYIS